MFPANTISGFSADACKALARAAQAAYSKASEIEGMARAAGATEFLFVESKTSGTQCFIAQRGNDLVIAFRGTEDVQDWITDAKFRREKFKPEAKCEVHRGFLGAFASVKADILSALVAMQRTHGRIWITGHSLGGALAILCASWLRRKCFYAQAVYTFGSPRVGNSHFAKAYDAVLRDKTFRVVNAEDVVPRTPFWTPHFCGTKFQSGYRHCGTEIFLNSFGEAQIDLPAWRKIPSDIYGLAMALDVVTPFTSVFGVPLRKHSMASYIERLNS